jgi:uncharacterized protein YvpB
MLSLLLVFMLCVSCAVEEPTVVIKTEDVVETLVLQTLEAYWTKQEFTTTELPGEQDAGEGPSVEVTQQVGVPSGEQNSTDSAGCGSGASIPESHYIWNIWGHRQYFGIGCEAAAAVDWADYFGVTVSEFNFQLRLPFSDNPDTGFVGSVNGPWGQVPPYAYGVHAAPIAAVLQEYYGMNAAGVKGFTIKQIKQEIASDQPVIAWVIGNCVGGVPYEYIDKDGNDVLVAAYEHVVILTGYNEENIRYMNNGKFYDIPYTNFENTWSVLENMVVYLAD